MYRLRQITFWFLILAFYVQALDSSKTTEKNGLITCLSSNGVPKHKIGKFPNKANPNKLYKQELIFCFPSSPRLTHTITRGLKTVGVSLDGIPIRPYTADYFDNNAKRGFSKNPSSGWRKQAMYDPRSLGIDTSNGHVDKTGLYHYHSIPRSFTTAEDTLFGYAPDGFQIRYNQNESSSWQLKSGMRPSPPGGVYNGQFDEDFEYKPQSGSLDKCNGRVLNGTYTYFATKSYPFFPRCFVGEIKSGFMKRN